jgi:hypothetical protein
MAPYCYRCPFNRARAERADARTYRQCHWECVGKVETGVRSRRETPPTHRRLCRMNRASRALPGSLRNPEGWLRRTAAIARAHEALLIADEVMTGFGRTGGRFALRLPPRRGAARSPLRRQGVSRAATCPWPPHSPLRLSSTPSWASTRRSGPFFHGHSFTGEPAGGVGIAGQPGPAARSGGCASAGRVGGVFGRRLETALATSPGRGHPAGRDGGGGGTGARLEGPGAPSI